MARRGRGANSLSDDDRALWKKVTDSAEALHPARAITFENFMAPRAQALPTPPVIKSFKIGEKTGALPKPKNLHPNLGDQYAKTSPNMDGRSFDRLKKGKMQVDGRIDLHGMTLAEAHPALTGFVLNAHMAGKRLLLVITGKGKTYQGEGLLTARRGILKLQVPQWLQMHPLAPKVLQVTQAHGKHGGGGALYVYLRRQR